MMLLETLCVVYCGGGMGLMIERGERDVDRDPGTGKRCPLVPGDAQEAQVPARLTQSASAKGVRPKLAD